MIEVNNRSEARSLNVEFYFTGLVCKNGHIAKRRSVNANCIECEKQTWKTWRNRAAYYYKDSKRWSRNNPLKHLVIIARARAKRLNIKFSITTEDISIPEYCPLLGILILLPMSCEAGTMSIDRIDNSKGYIPGNVWVISNRANILKRDATLSELELITKNLKEKLNVI